MHDTGHGEGIISPLEAISIAVGGSVGAGNIGVATAIQLVDWCKIWMDSSTSGMLIKAVEVTLAVYYRSKDEGEEHYGGPTYYMQKGLVRKKDLNCG